MADSYFARVRRGSGWSGNVVGAYLFGSLATVLVLLLMIDLGFLIELVDRGTLDGGWLPWLGPFLALTARMVHEFQPESKAIWIALLVLPGILTAAALAGVMWIYYGAVQGAALESAVRLRLRIEQQAFRLGSSDLLGSPTSRPEELFRDQVETVRAALFDWWLAIPRAYVGLVLLGLLALLLNGTLTIVALSLAGIIYYIHRWLVERGAATERIAQDRSRQQTQMLLDRLRLAPLVAGYALAGPPGEKFESDLARQAAAESEAENAYHAVFPWDLFLILASTALLLALIGYQGLQGQFTLAGAIVLGAVLIAASFPVRRLARLSDVQAAAETASEEIFAYLDREPSIVEATPAVTLGRLSSQLSLDNVKLVDRQGKVLLDGVAATFPARQRHAILATDLQTPMALAGLLVRLYDPLAGRVLFDGRELTRASLASLRKECLFVSAAGPLFTGSVQDNIACGDERITPVVATEAAKLAGCYEFVQQLPQGFATLIGPSAMTLEPSQAFRIGLARALAREPSLIVAEEPPGPLDQPTALLLEGVLAQISKSLTLVILPRRADTIRTADRVYLFHEAKLHLAGSHDELLVESELYRYLIYVRFAILRDQVQT